MAEAKYASITKYLEGFCRHTFGKWNEQSGDGSMEHPFVMPYFIYDDDVLSFIKDFYALGIADRSYVENMPALQGKPVSEMTEGELITKLTALIRGDRFCEGLINGALEDGTIQEVLERFKDI